LWAKEAGFELVHGDAYHPHYLTGRRKGFWNWTLPAVGLGLVAGMAEADVSPTALVAICRMHQLIARKPESKA
jgi:hypothetical protein